MGGSGCESVTLQLVELFGPIAVGVHVRAEIAVGVTGRVTCSPMFADCELVPNVAVRVTL